MKKNGVETTKEHDVHDSSTKQQKTISQKTNNNQLNGHSKIEENSKSNQSIENKINDEQEETNSLRKKTSGVEISNDKIQKESKQQKNQTINTKPNQNQSNTIFIIFCSSISTILISILLIFTLFSFGFIGSEIPGLRKSYELDWKKFELEMRENELQLESNVNQKQSSGNADLRMLWQTPLLQMNLKSWNVDVPNFNAKLTACILQHYRSLLDANPEQLKSKKTGHSYSSANQVFYDWQMSGGWKDIERDCPQISKLTSYMQASADVFLKSMGISAEEIGSRDKSSIHIWATVHESGATHMPHTHPDELVSGVYYLKMPKNAAPIIFDDPRGPRPPFDNRELIYPKEGDLVLFPSWLVHSVAPTVGDDERISIPFNVRGSWETTSSICTSPMPVKLPRNLF